MRVDVIRDRPQKVGLAQSGVAVDEERVVRLRGRFGNRQGGGVCESVAGAGDEVVEGVPVGCVFLGWNAGRGGLLGRELGEVHLGARWFDGEVEDGGVESEQGLVIDTDLEVDLDSPIVDLTQRISDDPEVAGFDAILDHPRRHGHRDLVAGQVDRLQFAKGRVPHDVGHLGANEVCARCPQLPGTIHDDDSRLSTDDSTDVDINRAFTLA